MKLRVLLADDHQMIREGLRSLIASESDMEVVGQADNGREAVKLAAELSPDVVVMDVGMPDLNGIEATRQILAASPQIKVLALSMYSDARYASGMLQAGAKGYVVKQGAFDELVLGIRTVAQGQAFLSAQVANVVVEDYARRLAADSSTVSQLTEREREIVQLVAEGRSTKEIADALGVSAKTVETHRGNIMSKLGLHSIADLTKYAIREGLTSEDA